jgi:HPt (histidine-containing phosphotransfer) domain-containing protein
MCLHKLMGGAGSLGARAIQHLAAEAEAACVAGDAAGAGKRSIELASLMEALQSSAALSGAAGYPFECSRKRLA